MAAGLSGAIPCVIFAILIPIVSARDNCKSYRDGSGAYVSSKVCPSFCCGTCTNRYCCSDSFWRLTEDKQEDCYESMEPNSTVAIGSTVASIIILIVIFISCCVCPCCCIYKMCRKPQPVIATTSTHTTVITHTPQHYPQQPRATPTVQVQSYQGGPYPGYQPVQPGYSAQPMPQAYGAQPAQPPAAAYPGYTPGPPPPYQEAMAPGYGPSPMGYSQAAFSPGQAPYPLQPPNQPYAQANAPPPPADHGQPAFNPAYAPPPPKTGY